MRKTYSIVPSHDAAKPWLIVCDQDGWTHRCRTLEAAMHWLDVLNGSDDEPVDLQVRSPRSQTINAAIWATMGGQP